MKLDSVLSLDRARPLPQPDFYPRLYVDSRTGDLRMGPQAGQGRAAGASPDAPPEQGSDDVEYRVELDVYNGPLDLLLYLIKRDELDVYDIPISRITESYMQYVRMLRELETGGLDINVAGDFLVMAATLMEVKSAMLLPKPKPEPGKETDAAADLTDPRYELVQKLLEYKRFKDSAAA